MKIQKIDDVNFNINMSVEGQDMNMKWRQGQLYISITSILLSDKDKWYEMPVREIESIQIVDDSVPKVKFAFKSYDVTLTSKNMDQLRALRHFLMPFIAPGINPT